MTVHFASTSFILRRCKKEHLFHTHHFAMRAAGGKVEVRASKALKKYGHQYMGPAVTQRALAIEVDNNLR